VKRKGNWVLYNRGKDCTVVKRGEKWQAKKENNAWQAYQVKRPTTTNAPNTKRPRKTRAPKPSIKPLASSNQDQDQDQVSGDPFAKLLNPTSNQPGSDLGPIDEEGSSDELANNSLADPVDLFQSHIGPRKQSIIPGLSDESHSLNLDTNFDQIDAIPTGNQNNSLGDDASLDALLSSIKDKVPNDNVGSQPTSDVSAQLSPTPSTQVNSTIDFNNLDLDVLESMNNF
jgi:hypothetical protein